MKKIAILFFMFMDNFAFVNATTAFEVSRTIGELPVIAVSLYDFLELMQKINILM